MKVAIFGASGFVGATLVEQLRAQEGVEVLPFIHSFGNAWRLSRAAIPLHSVDVLSRPAVTEAVRGCTHVVNCTRGASNVMLLGLKNILLAAKATGAKRFVHLSSVAVYGDPPPPESEREEAPARPPEGSYGAEKLKQDEMVLEAHGSGLNSVVLCPPNISGLYSSFVCNVLDDLRNGSFALVDGGRWALNVVDVDNLAYAIRLALKAEAGDGKRIFVADDGALTWKDLADGLAPLLDQNRPTSSVVAADVRAPAMAKKRPASVWRSLKHLVSSDVREALRRDPLLESVDKAVRSLVAAGGGKIEDRLRHSIEGPRKIAKVSDPPAYGSRYVPMQLRGVRHRIDRAQQVLGYEPPLSFAASMSQFRTWYQTMVGTDQPYWPLARMLYEA